MTNNLTEAIEDVYNKVHEFPRENSDKFELVTDGFRDIFGGGLNYCSFILYNEPKTVDGNTNNYDPKRGVPGRGELWKAYFSDIWYGLEKVARENGISCGYSNRIIHSLFYIYTNEVSLDVWSPIGRFLNLRPKVKAELRKKIITT
jgi:hypothetical protein